VRHKTFGHSPGLIEISAKCIGDEMAYRTWILTFCEQITDDPGRASEQETFVASAVIGLIPAEVKSNVTTTGLATP
jgi:hypothetical protein